MRDHDLPGTGDLALAQMDREERDEDRRLASKTEEEFLHDGECPNCKGGAAPHADYCMRCWGTGKVTRCHLCGEAKPEASIVRDGGGEWCPTCAAKALNDYHTETLKLQARIDGMRALINRTCGEVIAIAEGKAS
jgi:RecJ-like exonuclease